MPLDATLDRNATLDRIHETLEEVGYVVIERAADAETMDRLDADFDPYMNAVPLCRNRPSRARASISTRWR